MSRPIPSPSDMRPIPGHPGELGNPVIMGPMVGYTAEHDLWISDCYGQGHLSREHTILGTCFDNGPYNGDWDEFEREAIPHACKLNWVPLGYTSMLCCVAWAGHGPPSVAGANAHAHTTILTWDAYLRGDMPNWDGAPLFVALKVGDHGPRVKRLTNKLSRIPVKGDPEHRYVATPTDNFDVSIKQSVIAFQRDHQDTDGKPLAPDGVVGLSTMDAINRARRQAEKAKTIDALKHKLANIEENATEARKHRDEVKAQLDKGGLGDAEKAQLEKKLHNIEDGIDHYAKRAKNVRQEIVDLGGNP